MGILGLLGVILFLVGWIWLMIVAAKSDGALWAVLIFFFSIIAGLIYCIMKKNGWTQWAFMVVGWLIIIFGGGMAAMSSIR